MLPIVQNSNSTLAVWYNNIIYCFNYHRFTQKIKYMMNITALKELGEGFL